MRQATLKSLREEWEKGYTLMDEWLPNANTMLVILKDKTERYFCHRYYKTIEGWFVSVDVRNGHVVTVFSWIRDPKSRTVTENAKQVFHKLPMPKRPKQRKLVESKSDDE